MSKLTTQDDLVTLIKTHITRGDRAAEKSSQHYISAGQYLKTLKVQHEGNWAAWEALLKTKVGISKSRASELMQIADGHKTIADVRGDTAERTRKSRKKVSPLRSGEDARHETASNTSTALPALADKALVVARQDGGQTTSQPILGSIGPKLPASKINNGAGVRQTKKEIVAERDAKHICWMIEHLADSVGDGGLLDGLARLITTIDAFPDRRGFVEALRTVIDFASTLKQALGERAPVEMATDKEPVPTERCCPAAQPERSSSTLDDYPDIPEDLRRTPEPKVTEVNEKAAA